MPSLRTVGLTHRPLSFFPQVVKLPQCPKIGRRHIAGTRLGWLSGSGQPLATVNSFVIGWVEGAGGGSHHGRARPATSRRF